MRLTLLLTLAAGLVAFVSEGWAQGPSIRFGLGILLDEHSDIPEPGLNLGIEFPSPLGSFSRLQSFGDVYVYPGGDESSVTDLSIGLNLLVGPEWTTRRVRPYAGPGGGFRAVTGTTSWVIDLVAGVEFPLGRKNFFYLQGRYYVSREGVIKDAKIPVDDKAPAFNLGIRFGRN